MIIKLVRLSILAIALMLVPTTVDARVMNFAPNMTNTDGGLYVVNCNEAISLRRAPSFDAEVILEIPLGEVVRVSEQVDDYVHVEAGTQFGIAQNRITGIFHPTAMVGFPANRHKANQRNYHDVKTHKHLQ